MVFTDRVLASSRLKQRFNLVHVDVSDHRGLGNIGRIDLTNIALAVKHMFGLIQVLWQERPSVVYVPLAQNRIGLSRDFIILALSLAARARVVGHVHGGAFAPFLENAPAWFRALARLLLRRTQLIVMSDAQRALVKRILPAVRVDVVRHGTPSAPDCERDHEDRPLKVLYVSSYLAVEKGIDVVLEAAKRSQAAGLTSEWDVAGAWLSEQDERQFARFAAAIPKVNIRGTLSREELSKAYCAADVFVFPTTAFEGFAMVRIEAMAAGLPVITTPAGAAEEIIHDGQEGFIVDYDAPDQIMEKLALLRFDPARRADMGKQARNRQRVVFSEQAFEAALAHVLSSAAT